MPTQSAPVAATDPLDPAVLVRPGCLATLEQVAETTSTMERARQMALDAALPLPAAVVADAAGKVAIIDAATGETLWEFDAGGGFSAGAAVAAGRVVLASDDGILWCFRSGD